MSLDTGTPTFATDLVPGIAEPAPDSPATPDTATAPAEPTNPSPVEVSSPGTPAAEVAGDARTDDDDDLDGDDPGDGDGLSRARKQAANYRGRLREVETERDQLAAQLTAQQRAVVELRAREVRRADGIDADFLTAAGLDLPALLDDRGVLDVAKVDEFLATVLERFGIPVDYHGLRPNRAQGQGGLGPFGPTPFGSGSIESAFKSPTH